MFNYEVVVIICTNQFILCYSDIGFTCLEGKVWGCDGWRQVFSVHLPARLAPYLASSSRIKTWRGNFVRSTLARPARVIKHFLKFFVKNRKIIFFKPFIICAVCIVAQCVPLFQTPRTVGFSVQGDSPGKNTGVGCHALLQGTFPTQDSNPGFQHCRWILYHLSH